MSLEKLKTQLDSRIIPAGMSLTEGNAALQAIRELEQALDGQREINNTLRDRAKNGQAEIADLKAQLAEAEQQREYERAWKESFSGLSEKLTQTVESLCEGKAAAEARADAAVKLGAELRAELAMLTNSMSERRTESVWSAFRELEAALRGDEKGEE